jgi:hypothetical protein
VNGEATDARLKVVVQVALAGVIEKTRRFERKMIEKPRADPRLEASRR